jgi:hypothetical protein
MHAGGHNADEILEKIIEACWPGKNPDQHFTQGNS